MKDRDFRALVVDDDPMMRTSLEKTLPNYGFRVDAAGDGVTALNRCRTTHYDLLVTDLRMPRMHGHRLISEVLEQPCPPVVVVVTAVAEPNLIRDLLGRGVADVVIKPFPVDVFAAKVSHLLEHARGAAAGPSTAPGSVVRDIGRATTDLERQLASLRGSFEQTIAHLRARREELEAGYLGSLRVFANLMAENAPLKGSHLSRVEALAVAMAGRAGISGNALMDIQMAALLHEIGQFGMRTEVRGKSREELDPEERAGYEKYPLVGATLLSEIPNADGVVALVEGHAENFDGTGFPRGLAGDEIPLGSRIIRIADGFDTARTQARADAGAHALRHLKEGSNSLYDPDLVAIAEECLAEDPGGEESPARSVPADTLQTGMRLARNVYDRDGRYLARQGAVLSESLAGRLRSLLGSAKVEVVRAEHEG